MIPVLLDVSDVMAEFSMSRAQSDQFKEFVVKRLSSRYYEIWLQTAGQQLHSSRMQYQRSLVLVDKGRFKKAVMLTNKFPNMVEQGASAFDMKKGFEHSTKKKMSKSGKWYMTVPFRHATPGSLGESEVFSDIMPAGVYKAIKKKQASQTQIGGQGRTGARLRVNELPQEHQSPGAREATANVDRQFAKYVHKTSIYAGIGKSSKTYENATQGQYTTFRRVGENSDLDSWIYPGLVARNLADKALQKMNIERETQVAVDNFLAGG